jgi:RNA polymerase Rpc34 subunit
MSDSAGAKRRRKEEILAEDEEADFVETRKSSDKGTKKAAADDSKKKRRKASDEDDSSESSSDSGSSGSDSDDDGGRKKKASKQAEKSKKGDKDKKTKKNPDDGYDQVGGDGSEGLRAQVLKLLDEASGLKKGEEDKYVRTSSLGMPSKVLLKRLGGKGDEKKTREIGAILQTLHDEKRIEIFKRRNPDGSESQSFRSNTPEKAKQLKGLKYEEEAVLGMIERSGGNGIWTRSMKASSKMTTVSKKSDLCRESGVLCGRVYFMMLFILPLLQAELNKILKKLENKKLIKSVHSVAFKNRRMYMSYDIEPSKEVTGGVWYNEAQLDTQFIMKIKKASVTAVSQLGGKASPKQVALRLKEKGETTNPLRAEDVTQLMDSLVWEGWLDYADVGEWRVKMFARTERAEIADRKFLMEEKVPKKKKGKEGADLSDYLDDHGGGDYNDDFGYGGGSSSSGAAGAGAGSGAGAGAGSSFFDFDEDEDDDEDDDEEDGGAGAGAGSSSSSSAAAAAAAEAGRWVPGMNPADRPYVVAKKHNNTSTAPVIGDALTITPCGSCPVISQCVPGGLISPETCVYMSHWLQW